MKTIAEFIRALETEIPLGATYGADPVGLQVGDPREPLRGIMIAHDVDVSTVERAAKSGRNLIVCYHPVIYAPLARLDQRDPAAQVPLALARHGIAAYAVHTAFDTHPDGTNMLLAQRLGLRNIRPLAPLSGQSSSVSVYVPSSHVEQVSAAMWEAGAGGIGGYEQCSFRVEGTGTFRGGDTTNPTIGRKGKAEKFPEIRVSMVCPTWRLAAVLGAMRAAHPYEEIAYEVVALRNDIPGRGMGAIGELASPGPLSSFIAKIKSTTGAARVRTNGRLRAPVSRVAIVGGSGSGLMEDAVRANADVLLTGDVRYHTFRSAEGRIAIVDAGHRETERFVVDGLGVIIRRVLRSLKISHIRVVRATKSTNQILHV